MRAASEIAAGASFPGFVITFVVIPGMNPHSQISGMLCGCFEAALDFMGVEAIHLSDK